MFAIAINSLYNCHISSKYIFRFSAFKNGIAKDRDQSDDHAIPTLDRINTITDYLLLDSLSKFGDVLPLNRLILN